jgi:hypothetical protein
MDMPNSVTVLDITGTAPYEVYLCLSGGSPCYYIDYIYDFQIPYSFVVPTPIQNNPGYCLKITDGDNCTFTNCFTIN